MAETDDARHGHLTRDHAVRIVPTVPCTKQAVSEAVGVVIGYDNAMCVDKVNGAWVVFVSTAEDARRLIQTGIVVDGLLLMVSPLARPMKKVFLSNVPPFVTDTFLTEEISKHGTIVSPVRRLLAGNVGPVSHMTSYRRECQILPHNRNADLNYSITVSRPDWDYVIFIQSGRPRCYKCGITGHFVRNCPGVSAAAERRGTGGAPTYAAAAASTAAKPTARSAPAAAKTDAAAGPTVTRDGVVGGRSVTDARMATAAGEPEVEVVTPTPADKPAPAAAMNDAAATPTVAGDGAEGGRSVTAARTATAAGEPEAQVATPVDGATARLSDTMEVSTSGSLAGSAQLNAAAAAAVEPHTAAARMGAASLAQGGVDQGAQGLDEKEGEVEITGDLRGNLGIEVAVNGGDDFRDKFVSGTTDRAGELGNKVADSVVPASGTSDTPVAMEVGGEVSQESVCRSRKKRKKVRSVGVEAKNGRMETGTLKYVAALSDSSDGDGEAVDSKGDRPPPGTESREAGLDMIRWKKKTRLVAPEEGPTSEDSGGEECVSDDNDLPPMSQTQAYSAAEIALFLRLTKGCRNVDLLEHFPDLEGFHTSVRYFLRHRTESTLTDQEVFRLHKLAAKSKKMLRVKLIFDT